MRRVKPYALNIPAGAPGTGGQQITMPLGSKIAGVVGYEGSPFVLIDEPIGVQQTMTMTFAFRRLALPGIQDAHTRIPAAAIIVGVIPELRLVVLTQ